MFELPVWGDGKRNRPHCCSPLHKESWKCRECWELLSVHPMFPLSFKEPVRMKGTSEQSNLPSCFPAEKKAWWEGKGPDSCPIMFVPVACCLFLKAEECYKKEESESSWLIKGICLLHQNLTWTEPLAKLGCDYKGLLWGRAEYQGGRRMRAPSRTPCLVLPKRWSWKCSKAALFCLVLLAQQVSIFILGLFCKRLFPRQTGLLHPTLQSACSTASPQKLFSPTRLCCTEAHHQEYVGIS